MSATINKILVLDVLSTDCSNCYRAASEISIHKIIFGLNFNT